MADIRINSLSTTASSTASDDFIAVDGTTNGTRKLNAYSPTFGGNLTANGGNSSFKASGASDSVLTVHQTGTGSAAAYAIVKCDASPSQAYGGFGFEDGGTARWFIGGQGGYVNAAHDFNVTVAGSYALTINRSSRNVLLGTTTDSSNGKLQLTSHTTSAGGVGFGTETALYRAAAGSLVVDHIGGSAPTLNLSANGSIQSRLFFNGTNTFLESYTSHSLILRTNQTAALTLDSSQNATFAGDVTISTAYPKIALTDTNSNSDFSLINDNGRLAVYDETNAAYRVTVGAGGGVKIGTTPEDVGANNLTVQGTVAVSGTLNVGTGASNSSYQNIYTNKSENTAGPVSITLPSDCTGTVRVSSYQSGVGRSFRTIPFLNFGGTVTLGTSDTTVVTADPVTSVAAGTGAVTLNLVAANTNVYWGIDVVKA